MTKFHINKNGVPAQCRATERPCPLGGEDTHFKTKQEAQNYVDEKASKEFGLINTPKAEKTTQKAKVTPKTADEIENELIDFNLEISKLVNDSESFQEMDTSHMEDQLFDELEKVTNGEKLSNPADEISLEKYKSIMLNAHLKAARESAINDDNFNKNLYSNPDPVKEYSRVLESYLEDPENQGELEDMLNKQKELLKLRKSQRESEHLELLTEFNSGVADKMKTYNAFEKLDVSKINNEVEAKLKMSLEKGEQLDIDEYKKLVLNTHLDALNESKLTNTKFMKDYEIKDAEKLTSKEIEDDFEEKRKDLIESNADLEKVFNKHKIIADRIENARNNSTVLSFIPNRISIFRNRRILNQVDLEIDSVRSDNSQKQVNFTLAQRKYDSRPQIRYRKLLSNYLYGQKNKDAVQAMFDKYTEYKTTP